MRSEEKNVNGNHISHSWSFRTLNKNISNKISIFRYHQLDGGANAIDIGIFIAIAKHTKKNIHRQVVGVCSMYHTPPIVTSTLRAVEIRK